MIKHITFLAILFFSLSILHAQNTSFTQTVKGIITDEQSGNVLSGVTLAVEGLQPVIAAGTDSAGNFKLKNVPVGRRTFKASMEVTKMQLRQT